MEIIDNKLIENLKSLIITSRKSVAHSVNTIMVQTYWNIGKTLVEDEQQGEKRAKYGKQQLKHVSEELTKEFGKGFNTRNLRNMRQFYQTFPIWQSVNAKLSWTHYVRLIRIENLDARQWYINECIENSWSARDLDRQISKLYYERLLSSKEKSPLKQEAEEKTKPLQIDAKDMLRDPYIFDFLNISDKTLFESDIEQSLIDNLQKFLLELGRGFAFVSRQERLGVEEQDFYIDLPFLPTEEELRVEILRERKLLVSRSEDE